MLEFNHRSEKGTEYMCDDPVSFDWLFDHLICQWAIQISIVNWLVN